MAQQPVFMSIVLWSGKAHVVPSYLKNAYCGKGLGETPSALRCSFYLIRSSPADVKCLAKNYQGSTLSVSFWCPYQKLSLSLSYFNKTLLYKISTSSRLVSAPGSKSASPEVMNPGMTHGLQQQPFIGNAVNLLFFTVNKINNIKGNSIYLRKELSERDQKREKEKKKKKERNKAQICNVNW